jgi:hypothetical protein
VQWSSKSSFHFMFSEKNYSTQFFPHVCYMSLPSYSPLFYHYNNIVWRVTIVKLLFFFIFSILLLLITSFRSKYYLQKHFLKHHNLCSLVKTKDQVLHAHKITAKIKQPKSNSVHETVVFYHHARICWNWIKFFPNFRVLLHILSICRMSPITVCH